MDFTNSHRQLYSNGMLYSYVRLCFVHVSKKNVMVVWVQNIRSVISCISVVRCRQISLYLLYYEIVRVFNSYSKKLKFTIAEEPNNQTKLQGRKNVFVNWGLEEKQTGHFKKNVW